ncbi:MAG: TIGR03986 family CRISPR-associated RAMP protein [Planctomycetaceae bacterium]
MSDEFYNPFHFVPVEKPSLDLMKREDLKQPPMARSSHSHVTHDRYVGATHSGRIVCKLRLDTPTVLGASRTQGTDSEPGRVEPYQVLAQRTAGGNKSFVLEPAIPETSLRGMIGLIYEAATNSALRVLSNTLYSVRKPIKQASQAVGIVREKDGKRFLLPLAFPLYRQDDATVPEFFRPFQNWMQVKFYIHGFSDQDSQTPDTEGVYFLKAKFSQLSRGRIVSGGTLAHRGETVFARRGGNAQLLTRDEWLAVDEAERHEYIPGVLRNFGEKSSQELQNVRERSTNGSRRRDLPRNVKHRWFIPLKPEIYDPEKNEWLDHDDQWIPIETAAQTFEQIAQTRTEDDIRLPFEIRGSLRNDKLRERTRAKHPPRARTPQQHYMKIRHGDLVCFSNDASEISISSIWRGPAGTAAEWFASIDVNLRPMNPDRNQVTLAEQVFGFVDQDEDKVGTRQVKALASRVQFSSGRLFSAPPVDGYFEAERTAKILDRPKPPSPFLYFARRNGKPVRKEDLKSRSGIDPQGRKWYLHHDPNSLDWVTVDENARKKQKARLKPLKTGLEFVFDVRFDNLSDNELAMLVYALSPTDTFRHRLGMGKPLGLGTVQVVPVRVELVDRTKRYRSDDPFADEPAGCTTHLLAEPLDLNHAADEVQQRYAITVKADLPADQQWIAAQRQQAVKLIPPDIRAVLEALGDPANTAEKAVHYPRLPDDLLPNTRNGKKDTESKLFQWHAWNQDRQFPQYLKKLSRNVPFPQTLAKQAPFFFFVYDGLPAQQRDELFQLLQTHYPDQFHPTEPNAVQHQSADYRNEIKQALARNQIPVHIGVELRNLVEDGATAKNYGPLEVLNNRTKQMDPKRVLKQFKDKYLAPLKTNDQQ